MSTPHTGATTSETPREKGPRPQVTLGEATRVWARIGLLSFGGPAGQIALMHRIVVQEKGWISERRFLHALNFCMLLPGPEAQQLATYVGWLLHRLRGGVIAGSLFILPGFVVILALSQLYVAAGNLPLVQGLFAGLKAAVIGIVVQAIVRIGGRSLRSVASAVVAVLAFLAMFIFKVPFPYVILAAGLVGALTARPGSRTRAPSNAEHPGAAPDATRPQDEDAGHLFRCLGVCLFLWLVPTLLLVLTRGRDDVFSSIALFFSKMAVVTFGGAYAVLAYVSQEAVATYGWLAPGEMIDGLAMAETTPGPLIMVTQFVGFVAAYRDPGTLPPGLAALLGAILTTWVTFVPCFLWIFVGAPYVERLRRNQALSGALAGVTASVVGVIANLALWFSLHALFSDIAVWSFTWARIEVPVLTSLQVPSLLMTLLAALLLFRFRSSVLVTLTVTGALGILIHHLGLQ